MLAVGETRVTRWDARIEQQTHIITILRDDKLRQEYVLYTPW